MRRFQSLFRTLSAVILDRPHMLTVSCHLNTCVRCTHASVSVCVCVCLAIIQYDKPKTISKGKKNDNRSQFPYCLLEFVFVFGFGFAFFRGSFRSFHIQTPSISYSHALFHFHISICSSNPITGHVIAESSGGHIKSVT